MEEEVFPVFFMTILATAVFSSAISLSGLFPYVGFMVIYLGKAKNEDEAGYYSGYIASAMMFGRLVSSFWWGQIADRWGRKPVIIIGCLSIAIFSTTFGFSSTFEFALVSRFLLGLTNPIWGIAKTLVSELCPPKHEARGMGLTTGCWSLGLVIGPACGGLLASPAQLYPKYFSGTLFETYPYLLPNLVTTSFALLACFLLFLFFPETLHLESMSSSSSTSASSSSSSSSSPSSSSTSSSSIEISSKYKFSPPPSPSPSPSPSNDNHSSPERGGASIMELARHPGVIKTLCAYLVISFSSICFDEVIPLWSMASHSHGGLQLPQIMIGTMLTITGVILTLYTLFIYPLIAQALGQNLSFKVSQFSLAILAIVTTILHSLPPSSSARFPLLVTLYTASKASSSLGFASLAIILNHCVTKDKRGSLNGLSMTFGSIAKSVGPLFAAMIFAWSIDRIRPFPLDYRLVFLVISLSCIISVLIPLPGDEKKNVHEQQQPLGTGDGDGSEDQKEEDEEHGMIEMKDISNDSNKNFVNSFHGIVGKYLPLSNQTAAQEYKSVSTSEEEDGES